MQGSSSGAAAAESPRPARSACNCGGRASAKEQRIININAIVEDALKGLVDQPLSKNIKGVKGLFSRDKVCEPVEKGILRANNNVHIFKDGTSRFDATDMPMTHFYPRESQASVERLRALGYDKDYRGNELESGDQLLEMRHQDVILNRKGAEHFLNVARFIDQLLVKFYGMEPFYNITSVDDLIGHYVITLSPHTSAGVHVQDSGIHRCACRLRPPLCHIGKEEELRRRRGHHHAPARRAYKLLAKLPPGNDRRNNGRAADTDHTGRCPRKWTTRCTRWK